MTLFFKSNVLKIIDLTSDSRYRRQGSKGEHRARGLGVHLILRYTVKFLIAIPELGMYHAGPKWVQLSLPQCYDTQTIFILT